MMMAMAVAAAVGVQPDAAITWHTSRDRTWGLVDSGLAYNDTNARKVCDSVAQLVATGGFKAMYAGGSKSTASAPGSGAERTR